MIKYLMEWEKKQGLYTQHNVLMILFEATNKLYIPKQMPKSFVKFINLNVNDFFVHKSRVKIVEIPLNDKNIIQLIVQEMIKSNNKHIFELALRIPLVSNLNVKSWAYTNFNFNISTILQNKIWWSN